MCIEVQAGQNRRLARAAGVSLIETVIFMVIVSVALLVVLKAFDVANLGSADPLLRRQALAIAQAMLDEINFKPFANPDGGYAGPYNTATRSQFDDVMDYHAFSMNGIRRLDNAEVPGLSHYRVEVSVQATAFAAVPDSAGYRISVSVTDPANNTLTLESYRANY